MISLEKNPQPTRALLNIERLQAWSTASVELLYNILTDFQVYDWILSS